MQTRTCLAVACIALFQCASVLAQTATTEGSGVVEIRRTPVAEIPPQYTAAAPKPRKPFTVRYTCPDAGRIVVVFDNAQQTATLESGNTIRYLKQGQSGSGARYVNSDESYVFWVKGQNATINGGETCTAD